MKLLDALEINNTITNTKGGEYYKSSYDANLDLFCAVSRFQEDFQQQETIVVFVDSKPSMYLIHKQ